MSFYRSFLSSPKVHLYHGDGPIHSFYRWILPSPGKLYLFTDHRNELLQLWMVLPFPGQLYLETVQTIHSFNRSFLSSPKATSDLFTDQSIAFTAMDGPIVSRSPGTFLRTIHSFYRSWMVPSPGTAVPFYGPSIALQNHS